MPLELAPDSLVLLVGASGSGKSWWAHSHFRDTQVVSSDRCRALVGDDEEDQGVNRQAFAVFYTIIRQRLSLGRLTVADSTGLEAFSRARLRAMAADWARPVHAVVFLPPAEVVIRQNRQRDRRVPEPVVERHMERVRQMVEARVLEEEGYASVHHVTSPEARDAAPCLVPPPPTPETRAGHPHGWPAQRHGSATGS